MLWMSSVTLWRLVRRYDNKTCVAIIVEELRPGCFKKATWCFGWSKIKQLCINYPHLGKDLLWSARICIMGHTILSTFETTRTHAHRRRRPAGRGILLIFGPTILKPPALMMYIVTWCIYCKQYNKVGIPDNSGPLSFHFFEAESLSSSYMFI